MPAPSATLPTDAPTPAPSAVPAPAAIAIQLEEAEERREHPVLSAEAMATCIGSRRSCLEPMARRIGRSDARLMCVSRMQTSNLRRTPLRFGAELLIRVRVRLGTGHDIEREARRAMTAVAAGRE